MIIWPPVRLRRQASRATLHENWSDGISFKLLQNFSWFLPMQAVTTQVFFEKYVFLNLKARCEAFLCPFLLFAFSVRIGEMPSLVFLAFCLAASLTIGESCSGTLSAPNVATILLLTVRFGRWLVLLQEASLPQHNGRGVAIHKCDDRHNQHEQSPNNSKSDGDPDFNKHK